MLPLPEMVSGGPVLLVFFKIGCPVCQMSAPFLQRISTGTGLRVVGVSQDSAGNTKKFAAKYGVTFDCLIDSPGDRYPVSRAYGIVSVPSLFLIEPDGRVGKAFSGFSKRDFEELGLRAAVETFRAEERVPVFRAG